MPHRSIPEILEILAHGGMIVLVDDPDRENEGDLILAAEKVTSESVAFMAKFGSGLICLALEEEIVEQLGLPLAPRSNGHPQDTAFTVSIEARHGVTTGISARDRATTVRAAIAESARPQDLMTPGHIFPLRARQGGVLRRAGQTEGSVDLARLAGLRGGAIICEIMNPDGTMARANDLKRFCIEHGLSLCSVADIIEYRRRHDCLVERGVGVHLPTDHGKFDLYTYQTQVDDFIHIALVKGIGDLADGIFPPLDDPILVRVHSECLTGDLLGSHRCDCGIQLRKALELIEKEGRGVLVYMRQEGRGIGLPNKLRAYKLQDEMGLDTVEANEALGLPADMRDYGIGAQILRDLGIRRMRLLTNNPRKYNSLQGYGLEIIERVPLQVAPNRINSRYLATKREKLGHLLPGF